MRKLLILLIRVLLKIICLFSEKNRELYIYKKLFKFKNRITPLNQFKNHEYLNYILRKKIGLDSNRNNIKTLAIRGSNAEYDFYSPSIEDSYNIGIASTDLYFAYYFLKNNEFPKLKNIVIFWSVATCGFSLCHIKERYRCVANKYFFNIPYQYPELINGKIEKKIIKECQIIERNIPHIPNNYKGYEEKKFFVPLEQMYIDERCKSHRRENERLPDQMSYFTEIIKLVQRKDQELFVILSPTHSFYKKEFQSSQILFHKLYSAVNHISNIKILNYYDTNIINDNDLGDTDHLTHKGAIKLTNDLKKYLIN